MNKKFTNTLLVSLALAVGLPVHACEPEDIPRIQLSLGFIAGMLRSLSDIINHQIVTPNIIFQEGDFMYDNQDEVSLDSNIIVLDQNEVDVNAVDLQGNTLLCWAIANHNHFAIQLLLEKGADVNAVNNNGNTPLREFLNNLPHSRNYLFSIRVIILFLDDESFERDVINAIQGNNDIIHDNIRYFLTRIENVNEPITSFVNAFLANNHSNQDRIRLIQCLERFQHIFLPGIDFQVTPEQHALINELIDQLKPIAQIKSARNVESTTD